jgi:hypothetical protein
MGSRSCEESTLTSRPQLSSISSLDFIKDTRPPGCYDCHIDKTWSVKQGAVEGTEKHVRHWIETLMIILTIQVCSPKRGDTESCFMSAYTYNTSLVPKKRWYRKLLHKCQKIHWFIRSYTNVVKFSSKQLSCQAIKGKDVTHDQTRFTCMGLGEDIRGFRRKCLTFSQIGVLTPDSSKEENNHIMNCRPSMTECFLTCRTTQSFLKVDSMVMWTTQHRGQTM